MAPAACRLTSEARQVDRVWLRRFSSGRAVFIRESRALDSATIPMPMSQISRVGVEN